MKETLLNSHAYRKHGRLTAGRQPVEYSGVSRQYRLSRNPQRFCGARNTKQHRHVGVREDIFVPVGETVTRSIWDEQRVLINDLNETRRVALG